MAYIVGSSMLAKRNGLTMFGRSPMLIAPSNGSFVRRKIDSSRLYTYIPHTFNTHIGIEIDRRVAALRNVIA